MLRPTGFVDGNRILIRTIAAAGHQQTRAGAEAQATVNYWSAETTAANARLTAERTALADFRGADLSAQAAAIADIHTTLALPWTEYQSLLAAAKSQWWTTDGRSSLLAQTTAETTAASAYQAAVAPAYIAWSASVALAEKNLTTSIATDSHAKRAGILTSDADYEKQLSIADRVWQIAYSTTQGDYFRADAAGNRAFAPDFDEPARAAITTPAVEAHTTAHETNRSAFFTAESLSASGQSVGKALGRKTNTISAASSETTYVTAAATADLAYTTAESTAAAALSAALAAAFATRIENDTATLAEVIDDLATSDPSPWSAHDAALAAVTADYHASLRPAYITRVTAEAAADSTHEIALATAARTLAIAQTAASTTHRVALTSADVDRLVAENLAESTALITLRGDQLQAAAKGITGDSQPNSSSTPTPPPQAEKPDAGLAPNYQRPGQTPQPTEVSPTLQQLVVKGLTLGQTSNRWATLAAPKGHSSRHANIPHAYQPAPALNQHRNTDSTTPEEFGRSTAGVTSAAAVLARTPKETAPLTAQERFELAKKLRSEMEIQQNAELAASQGKNDLSTWSGLWNYFWWGDTAEPVNVLTIGAPGDEFYASVTRLTDGRYYAVAVGYGREESQTFEAAGGSDPAIDWVRTRETRWKPVTPLLTMIGGIPQGVVDGITQRDAAERLGTLDLSISGLEANADRNRHRIELFGEALAARGDSTLKRLSVSGAGTAFDDASKQLLEDLVVLEGKAVETVILVHGAIAAQEAAALERPQFNGPGWNQTDPAKIHDGPSRVIPDDLVVRNRPQANNPQTPNYLRPATSRAVELADELIETPPDAKIVAPNSRIIRSGNKSRVVFDGMEVRGVRDLSHVSDSTLKQMAKDGFAAKDINGKSLQLHHLEQNPAGPVVEIPGFRHEIINEIQHPFGNAPGAGLTAEQRAAFDAWRVNYWKARAAEELARRGITL